MLNTAQFGSRNPHSPTTDSADDLHWYAISTRSRHEKLVRDRLAGIGIEPFLPLVKRLSEWSDRKVWTESPLFSGYCFARFSLMHSHAVLQTPGTVNHQPKLTLLF